MRLVFAFALAAAGVFVATGALGEILFVKRPVVNVRAEPTAESAVVAQLESGDSVEVSGRESGWSAVEMHDGRGGWIRSDLLGPSWSAPPALVSESVESTVGLILGLAFLGLLLFIYMLPAYIAGKRNHPNSGAITTLNLLLGWTSIVWVAVLLWAISSTGEDRR